MNAVKKVLLSSTIALLLALNTSGTVFADDLKTGTVTATVLNIRSGPGISSKIIGRVYQGKALQLVSSSGNWYKIQSSGVVTGWASKTYIKAAVSITSRGTTLSDRGSSSLDLRAEFVDYAKTFLGVPYVWGGTSPKGFDCSGLVQYVYSHFGYSLKRVSVDQATQGIAITKSQLQPGDLVFFDTKQTASKINHVGMYIGDGKFIQASSGRGRVLIDDITTGFYSRTFMKARRILD